MSAREIYKAAQLVIKDIDQMDRWVHFVRTARTHGYAPQITDGASGKVFNIQRASTGGLGGRDYGLVVIPIDAKLKTEEFSITPVKLRTGDYSPSFEKGTTAAARKLKAKRIDRLRRLDHDI